MKSALGSGNLPADWAQSASSSEPASWISRGNGPHAGQATATSLPAGNRRNAARRSSPAPCPATTCSRATPCRAAIASRRGSASGYALSDRRSAYVAALTASAWGGSCQAADVRSSGTTSVSASARSA